MTFKITNALRYISIIVLTIVFFISYAGLPEKVLLFIDESGNPIQYVLKNYFFYGTLTILIITNALLYILAIILNKSIINLSQLIANYLLSLSIIINVFFSVALTFLGILNGQENFDYSSFAPFIYFSQGLFVVWLLAFIYSLIRSKKNCLK